MKREIKFRAWAEVGKTMLSNDDCISNGFCPTSTKEVGKEGIATFPLVWMQFTGLHDKNGKEIYEGDIVIVDIDGDRTIHSVVWYGETYPAFELSDWDSETNGLSEVLNAGTIEVIGNIYENSELLK